jgi:hypothetical protein
LKSPVNALNNAHANFIDRFAKVLNFQSSWHGHSYATFRGHGLTRLNATMMVAME